MSGTKIEILLDGNIIDALYGANAPSAGNVFATMADLGAGFNTIYSADDSLIGNRTVTQAGFWLSFTGGDVAIGFSGAPAAKLDIRGLNSLSSSYALRVADGSNALLFNVANDGFVGIGVSAPIVNTLSRFSVRDTGAQLWCEFMDGIDTNTGLIFRKDSDISSMVNIGTRNGLNAEDTSKYASIGFNNATGYLAFGGYPYALQKFTFNLNYQGNNPQESFNISGGLHTINTGARILFTGAPNTASNTQSSYGAIEVYKENATNTNFAAYMAFFTSPNAALIEAMRISSSQNVSIGTTTEPSKLTVNGDVETLTNAFGYIVLDRTDGNRYRIYTNAGVVLSELA